MILRLFLLIAALVAVTRPALAWNGLGHMEDGLSLIGIKPESVHAEVGPCTGVKTESRVEVLRLVGLVGDNREVIHSMHNAHPALPLISLPPAHRVRPSAQGDETNDARVVERAAFDLFDQACPQLQRVALRASSFVTIEHFVRAGDGVAGDR